MKRTGVCLKLCDLMLFVAIAAFLCPVPIDAVALLGLTALFGLLVLGLVWACCEASGRGSAGKLAVGILAGSCSLLLLLGLASRGLDLLTLVGVGLTSVNVVGPIFAACDVCRGRRLFSGEWLWAWAGVVWILIFFPGSNSVFDTLTLMAEFARISLVVVLLLARYGSRPLPTQTSWSHRAGWILMECDVVFCGWYASRFLR